MILVPKGRVYNYFKFFLKKKNIIISEIKRQLIYTTNSFFKIIKVKSEDIYYLIKNKHANIGIIGSDVFYNNGIFRDKKISFLKMNFFKCRISLIRNKYINKKRNYLFLSTKYDNIAKKISKHNKIIKINGSNEICIKLKVSDYILDIVSTGETIKKNNLFEIYKIYDVYPILFYLREHKNVVNPIIEILK
ncbi:ATP phosphoribosyltransferase [Candidatus Vidania fulgoroideorum]